jgi:membrane fusion protein (multidrug efflux system)
MMRLNKCLKWSPLALAAAALAAACLTACSRRSAGDEEGSGAVAASIAEVTITRVARADISSTLTVTGTIAALPNQDVRVSSLVPGRIARMMVAEGDHVQAGQALAGIEERPFLDQIQQAEAAVDQAEANLENSRLALTRNEDLFQRGIAARKDLEDARTQVSVGQAGLSQAQATLALARLQLSRSRILAPLDGTLVKRFVSVGEQVDGTGNQPILEVANLRQVELFGNVPGAYLGRMRLGQELNVSTDAFPGKAFKGRVVAISPAVDPATNVGLMRIRISNEAGLLRLGMFLSAQVPLETHANALVVPTEAVYRNESGQPQVYRLEGGEAVAVPVKLGIETQNRVELLSGVQAGETVILAGGYGLSDHAKVKVKP